jgi:hypothetical protein
LTLYFVDSFHTHNCATRGFDVQFCSCGSSAT